MRPKPLLQEGLVDDALSLTTNELGNHRCSLFACHFEHTPKACSTRTPFNVVPRFVELSNDPGLTAGDLILTTLGTRA